MERNWDLDERTDGRLYDLNDMVKVGCQDCEGCSACCQGMENTILLDPLDISRMSRGLKMTFDEMLAKKLITLTVEEGVVLPCMNFTGSEERCIFLNETGRCGIHEFRPGICRIFPLGRLYAEETKDFRYILQVKECKKGGQSKVKVRKWIDTPELVENQKFIADWHFFVRGWQQNGRFRQEADYMRKAVLQILAVFYQQTFAQQTNFYTEFYNRMERFDV